MRCQQCGYHSYEGLRRCKKCGALLAQLELPPLEKRSTVRNGVSDRKSTRADNTVVDGVNHSSQVATKSCVQESVPPKTKPFPEFLLERNRHASFFEESENATSESITTQELGPLEPSEINTSLVMRRLGAMGVDLIVLGEIWYAFVAVGANSIKQDSVLFLHSIVSQSPLRIGYYLLAVTIVFSYFTIFHGSSGQTIGKLLFRLQVVGEEGAPPTLGQALLRSTGGVLAVLCLGVGYVAALFNGQRRGWNDRLADTRVVDVSAPSSNGKNGGDAVEGGGCEIR